MSVFVEEVAAFAATHALLPHGAHILVGVSGGPDSCVLLDVLCQVAARRDLQLTVAHFHHGRRAADADADAAFVSDRAKSMGLPCVVGRAEHALPPGERELREARYAWLGDVAHEQCAGHVAVGHTQDDQAETVLLRLIRGTGLRGLGAMAPARPLARRQDITLVRPLLGVSRDDVLAYAASRALTYRVDATNADTDRTRNRLRADILPRLRGIDPQVNARLASAADRLRADEIFLRDAARELGRSSTAAEGVGWCAFHRAALAVAPQPLLVRVLQEAYRQVAETPYAPDAELIDQGVAVIAGGDAKGAADWPGDVRVRWTPSRVTFSRIPARRELLPLPLEVPGTTAWAPTGQRIATRVVDGTAGTPASGFTAPLATVPGPLVLRAWTAGDMWLPRGRRTPEAVSETLRAMDVPVDRRAAAPVLAAQDRVWWVVGARPPEPVATTQTGEGSLEVTVGPHARRGTV